MSGQDCATVIDQGSVTLRSPVAAFPTWPEEFRRRYRELGYWTDETFAEFVADRVVVALPNVADFVAVVLGLFRLGALPIFALPTHRELELTQFCVTADAAAMVVATDDLAGLHAVVAEPKRGIVPAVGVEQFSGIKIEHADKQCDEHALGVVAGEVFVDLGHEVLRRGVGTRPRSDKGQGHAHEQ